MYTSLHTLIIHICVRSAYAASSIANFDAFLVGPRGSELVGAIVILEYRAVTSSWCSWFVGTLVEQSSEDIRVWEWGFDYEASPRSSLVLNVVPFADIVDVGEGAVDRSLGIGSLAFGVGGCLLAKLIARILVWVMIAVVRGLVVGRVWGYWGLVRYLVLGQVHLAGNIRSSGAETSAASGVRCLGNAATSWISVTVSIKGKFIF